MLDTGRNALPAAGPHDDVGGRIGGRDEAQRSGLDTQAAPCPAAHTVSAPEHVRHRALVPGDGRPHHGEILWDLASVAERTVDRGADAPIPLGGVLHPGGDPERRAVAHVLTMVT